jgi:hypothetical protein
MSSSSQINQSIKPAVQAVSTDPSAGPYIDAESPFEAATFAAASWRLKLDQLKLSGLFKIAHHNTLLYKADISRAELQDIIAEHLLVPFERIDLGLGEVPVLLLEDISLAGISGENGLLERLGLFVPHSVNRSDTLVFCAANTVSDFLLSTAATLARKINADVAENQRSRIAEQMRTNGIASFGRSFSRGTSNRNSVVSSPACSALPSRTTSGRASPIREVPSALPMLAPRVPSIPSRPHDAVNHGLILGAGVPSIISSHSYDAANRDIVSPSGQVNVSNVVSCDLLGSGVGGLLSGVFGDAPRSAVCAEPLSLSMLVHVTAAEMAPYPAFDNLALDVKLVASSSHHAAATEIHAHLNRCGMQSSVQPPSIQLRAYIICILSGLTIPQGEHAAVSVMISCREPVALESALVSLGRGPLGAELLRVARSRFATHAVVVNAWLTRAVARVPAIATFLATLLTVASDPAVVDYSAAAELMIFLQAFDAVDTPDAASIDADRFKARRVDWSVETSFLQLLVGFERALSVLQGRLIRHKVGHHLPLVSCFKSYLGLSSMPPSGVLKYGAKALADFVQSKTFSATPDSVWLSDYRSWAIAMDLTCPDVIRVAYGTIKAHCKICGSSSHARSSCPYFGICANCGGTHETAACTAARAIVPLTPCPRCFKMGHWKASCPADSSLDSQGNGSAR